MVWSNTLPIAAPRSIKLSIVLGSVDIHRDALVAAARCQLALWLQAVFSYLVAMARNSFIFTKKFSISYRYL